MLAALILGLRVKLRRTQYEQMFSASPLRTDIPQCSRHVRFVPTGDIDVLIPAGLEPATRPL
jgi:hypothetical protein